MCSKSSNFHDIFGSVPGEAVKGRVSQNVSMHEIIGDLILNSFFLALQRFPRFKRCPNREIESPSPVSGTTAPSGRFPGVRSGCSCREIFSSYSHTTYVYVLCIYNTRYNIFLSYMFN